MAERFGSRSKLLVRVIAVLFLTALAWRVLSLGMADAKLRSEPEQALQWRSKHSTALFLLAQEQAKDPAKHQEAKKNALAALQAYPLEGKAYRVLGQIAEAEKNSELAFDLFQKAVRYSPRDLESHLWLMNYSLRKEKSDAAVQHLDSLLRMQIDLLPPLMPTIGGLAVRPESQPALIRVLMKNPAWRTPALNTLMAEKGAAEKYAFFFNRLSKTGKGLNESEQKAWLNALNQNQQWSLAYLNWATQLPAARQLALGNLFNGDFEHEPLDTEFDWQFGNVPGASIELAAREGMTGQKALRVYFDDRRVPFSHLKQTLVLPPGSYRLSGRGFADDLRTDLGLVWSVQCLGTGIPLASSEPWKGRSPQWQPLSMEFAVPADQCSAQSLSLKLPARVPSEQVIAGSIWFDDLRVQKIQGLTERKPTN
jgi:tetratricopeptide (TPR) repeat protein